MKKVIWLILIIMCMIPVGVLAQEAVETTEVVSKSVSEAEGMSFKEIIWDFLNSSLGVSVVAFILTFILGKIFTAKPKWKQIVLQYGPMLMRAVKTAEKQIPDDTSNAGLSRLDAALKYLLEMEPALIGVQPAALVQALTAVHASAETNGNLKKE